MARTSIVLGFHESLLRQSDVELLKGPHWLNDTIISFYFEYLEKLVFNQTDNLLFVSPEVTQCIKMVQADEIKTFLDPLSADTKSYVFFALNDNDSPDMAGGSHWSLLVYSKMENCFFHLDSSCGSNHNVAWDLANHLKSNFSKRGHINFVEKECLQQSNGYDCGIHVICNSQRLAEHAQNGGQISSCDMLIKFNPSVKRKEILAIIHHLASANSLIIL